MSCLDLTAAVEAAAERAYTDYRMARIVSVVGLPGAERLVDELPEWGYLPAIDQHDWRERVRGVVIAAAPAIVSSAIPDPETAAVRIWDEIDNPDIAVAHVTAVLRHLRTHTGRTS